MTPFAAAESPWRPVMKSLPLPVLCKASWMRCYGVLVTGVVRPRMRVGGMSRGVLLVQLGIGRRTIRGRSLFQEGSVFSEASADVDGWLLCVLSIGSPLVLLAVASLFVRMESRPFCLVLVAWHRNNLDLMSGN